MVGIAEKEQEEKSAQAELQSRHHLRLAFWDQFLDAIKESPCKLYNNVNPVKDHWLSAGSGCSGVPYQCLFMKNGVRIQLNISRSSKEDNKSLFDMLHEQREPAENTFGHALIWNRMDDKKASIILHEQDFDGYNKAEWPAMIAWLIKHIALLEQALSKPLKQGNQQLKASPSLAES